MEMSLSKIIAKSLRRADPWGRSLVLVLAFLLFSGDLQAKSGIIEGRVRDGIAGTSLPGATVAVIGTSLGAVADESGNFKIKGVPAGTYSLRASNIGYSSLVFSDIVVNPVKPTVVDFTLWETPLELDKVVVRPEFFIRPLDAQVSVQSQASEEIRRLPGGLEDVVRAISILPGVAQVQNGRNDLIVRGGAPSENLYLIDNIEVSNINHFGTQGASGGPLSYINLDFVDNTTFSTGGFGVRYGDRLSSILDIDLREGRRDRLGGKATISASQFGLNAEGPLGQNKSFLFSARRSYLDLIFRAAGFEFVPEYWDFLLKTDWRPDNGNEIDFLAIGALDRVRFFNDDADDRYENSRNLYSDQDQVVSGLSWKTYIPDGFIINTLGQTYNQYAFMQNDSLLEPIFRSNSREYETSWRGELTRQVSPKTNFSLGLQARLVRTTGSLFIRPYTDPYGDEINAATDFEESGFKGAAYVQITQLVGRLKIVAGLRGDYFNLINNRTAYSPRLNLSYMASSRWTFSLAAGNYRQPPSMIWLAANPANKNLHYISAYQAVAGVEYLLRSDTRITLESYYKDYFDYPASLSKPYLVMANTGAGYGGAEESFASFGYEPLISAGKGRAYGLEFLAQKKLSEIPCYGTISLSLNRAEFAGADGIYRPGSFDQRFIGNFGGGYIFNEKWEMALKFRLATGRPYSPINPDGTRAADNYNSHRSRVNHSLDFRVDRRWFFENWTLIAYMDIQNIYNRKYIDVPRYDERTGTLDTVSSIGILPSIGISAEF